MKKKRKERKMKELFILAVVTVFTLVTYYVVEPLPNSVNEIHAESHNFAYADLPALTKKGDATRGKDLVMGAGACSGCHAISVAGVKAPMDAVSSAAAYGVNPPDLSNVGAIYAPKFLAALIKNPAHALILEHKFNAKNGRNFPMPSFYGAGGDKDQEIADMVAYLQSIAVSKDKLTPTMAFETACGRCHAVHYTKWTQIGETPKFKKEQARLGFKTNVLNYQDTLIAYLGKLPPDLSMYIRSRGEEYINNFVEDPQNYIKGTAMPRVGVSKEGAEKVMDYLKKAGDPKAAERNSVGKDVMIYLILFAIFAILWKREVWKDLH
jgi:ubiquinol-cytochrome c reductase cytochrome c1 subunit